MNDNTGVRVQSKPNLIIRSVHGNIQLLIMFNNARNPSNISISLRSEQNKRLPTKNLENVIFQPSTNCVLECLRTEVAISLRNRGYR